MFDSITGKLLLISGIYDDSKIQVQYTNDEDQFPSLFTHSNGKKMNITYTESGLISTVDILDEDENIQETRYILQTESGRNGMP